LMKAPKGAKNGQEVAKMTKKRHKYQISKKRPKIVENGQKGKVPIIIIIYWLLSIM